MDSLQKRDFRRYTSEKFLQESHFIRLATEETLQVIYSGGIPSGELLREKTLQTEILITAPPPPPKKKIQEGGKSH